MRGHGVLRVGHGDSRAARVFAGLLRLPAAGDAVDTTLVVTPAEGGERWHRTFGTRALDTRQYPVRDGGVAERFGPLELHFRREPVDGGTLYRQIETTLVLGPARVRLPRWCAPRVTAREDPAGDHRIRIDVRVELPLIGPVLTYAGTIHVDEASERAQPREPRERSARECAGEPEGRSPSDKT